MKNKGSVLIVDDNREILLSLKIFLEKHFEKVDTLGSPELIRPAVQKQDYDVFVLDMNFTASIKTGNEGLFWLKEILRNNPHASVIFITAFPGIELAVKAIKEGAYDFIEKPWNNEKLLTTLINAYKMYRSKREIANLREKQEFLAHTDNEDFVKSRSPRMIKLYDSMHKVASTEASVLILGENGTGKDFIAREIHKLSGRSSSEFIKVDVGSIPDALFESELFGHEKGAFTDAYQAKAGKIEIADGGTLFLDEIGNLPQGLQSKLLEVLQSKKITRIASNKPRYIDFRLICATNRPLYEMTEHGEFREDLLYRINTVQLEIPSLRERIKDIPLLANHFLEKYTEKYQRKDLRLDERAMEKLIAYPWPGNIRQLDHYIENMVIMAEDNYIRAENITFGQDKDVQQSFALNYYHNEKELINKALVESGGNLSKAADILGVARSTLYRKIRKYDL